MDLTKDICDLQHFLLQKLIAKPGFKIFWQYSDHSVRNFEAHHQKRVVGVSNIYQIRKEGGTKRGGDHTPIGCTRGSFPPLILIMIIVTSTRAVSC